MSGEAGTGPDWNVQWSPEVGLWWRQGPGHTPATDDLERVHPGREAASRILLAAVTGQLAAIELEEVLAALRSMQSTEPGPLQGCFRWYWEEETIHDTNAAFFIGLPLLALNAAFGDTLSDEAAHLLDEMLTDLRTWFVTHVKGRSFYYPNKYLGDLVCAWLLAEALERPADREILAPIFIEAADYWLHNGWGWGEHLSDVYAPVCLREISMLLLLADRLPETLHNRCRRLLDELMAIEDAYDGVRVPAIRSYSFCDAPEHTNFRETIRAVDEVSLDVSDSWAGLHHLLYELEWHELVGDQAEQSCDIEVPCFGGTLATAHITSDIRIGSLSRSPVMPNCEHNTWGLAWQTFPVCAWRPQGEWGFLQWAVVEDGEVRAHPAARKDYTSHGCAALTRHLNPPVYGRTYAIQHEGDILCLRIMPAIPASWERLTDRWRTINPVARPCHEKLSETCRQLSFGGVDGLAVQCLALTQPAEWSLQHTEDIWDFGITYEGPEPQNQRGSVSLWGVTTGGAVEQPPALQPAADAPVVPRDPHEEAAIVAWEWPNRTWHLRIDPLAPDPLVELQ